MDEKRQLERVGELASAVMKVEAPWDEEDLPPPEPLDPALRKRLVAMNAPNGVSRRQMITIAGIGVAAVGAAAALFLGYLGTDRTFVAPVVAFRYHAEREPSTRLLGDVRKDGASDPAASDTQEITLHQSDALILRIPPKQSELGPVEARFYLRRAGQVEPWKRSRRPDPATGAFLLYCSVKDCGFTSEQDLIITVGRPQALPDLVAIRANVEPDRSPAQRLWHKHTIHVRVVTP